MSYHWPGSGLNDTGKFTQHRNRLWSVETGYATGESTPFPTPLQTPSATPKKFEYPKIDSAINKPKWSESEPRLDFSENDTAFIEDDPPTGPNASEISKAAIPDFPNPVLEFKKPTPCFPRRAPQVQNSIADPNFPKRALDFQKRAPHYQNSIPDVSKPAPNFWKPIPEFPKPIPDPALPPRYSNFFWDSGPPPTPVTIPTPKRSIPKPRAITKAIVEEFTEAEEENMWKLADRVTEMRLALYEKGLWPLEDLMPFGAEAQKPKDAVGTGSRGQDDAVKKGWKYPRTVIVPSLGRPNRRFKKQQPSATCEFCYNNNHCDLFWKTHQCKNEYGEVVCPILSGLTCPECGATGKWAHTQRYCPIVMGRKQRALELGLPGAEYRRWF